MEPVLGLFYKLFIQFYVFLIDISFMKKYTLHFKSLVSVKMFVMFLKEVSYANQNCIYLIKIIWLVILWNIFTIYNNSRLVIIISRNYF